MRNVVAVAVFAALCLGALPACEIEEEAGPTIPWWSQRPHGDRGPCTRCHVKTDRNGRPVPTISADSRMPHMDRGVCSNCHPISVGGGARTGLGGGLQVQLERPLPAPVPVQPF